MDGQAFGGNGLDSITLGQLKSLVSGQNVKQKQSYFDFHYEDEDNLFEELNEFYAFQEVEQLTENLRMWQQADFTGGDWTSAGAPARKLYVVALLENLEHQDSFMRYATARRLLYLLQGTFAETTSPEHQMHWIIENCKTVRAADGVTVIVDALKLLSVKHEKITSITEADLQRLNVHPSSRQQWIDEVQAEISMCLGMLYPIVEVFRNDDEFAEELMTMEPPLPIYFFQMLANLKDRSAKSFPAKKLLLITWKSVLACLGGQTELARVKAVARELAGLSPLKQDVIVKATPIDMHIFRQETFVKYPTFTPVPVQEIPSMKLAEALAPIPVRHHYNHHDDNDEAANSILAASGYVPNRQLMSQNPQTATPAPSPPPSPKPKKQQYQTDQTKPFIFPFSSHSRVSKTLVPYAIDEADQLYSRHMHVSLALFQMWRTREDFILDESGLKEMPRDDNIDAALRRYSVINSSTAVIEDDDAVETLPDLKWLEEAISQSEKVVKAAEASGNRAEIRKAQERKEDLQRLRRVEIIYSASLPILPTWSLILLKFLLAVIGVNNANPMGSDPPPPAMTQSLEEIDALRHREIMTKALGALILLLLKWFKMSHVMKFHHLGHTLLDSNCLLLCLRLLGLQEVSTYVVTKNEIPERKFFRFCYENFGLNAHLAQHEDYAPNDQPPRQVIKTTTLPNGMQVEEEVDMISDFSWRNFFTVINLTKIMQKLTKGRPHRIMLLVHHKSTAIFKRMMRVSHLMLQLQLLKLIKSQVPYSGRKWKQLNMKLITAIYLNCRPDLRDEWLTATELDDITDAMAQETMLRQLVKFYNTKRYGNAAIQPVMHHRRSSSLSMPNAEMSPEFGIRQQLQSPPAQQDVFPPLRSQAADPSIFMPYPTEDIAFEEEYEEYLFDLNSAGPAPGTQDSSALYNTATAAWNRLPNERPIGYGISDSESVASISIGELSERTLADGKTEVQDDSEVGKNNWEHMSPKTLQALSKSPAGGAVGGRRSSSGTGLRPVLPFELDDAEGSAVDDDDEETELGHMPRETDAPFAAREGGRGVDEVEYMYGE